MDIDTAMSTDTSVSPARLTEEVTAIRADSEGKLKVGDKNYCIYDFADAGSMRVECNESAHPAAFSDEATTFTKM